MAFYLSWLGSMSFLRWNLSECTINVVQAWFQIDTPFLWPIFSLIIEWFWKSAFWLISGRRSVLGKIGRSFHTCRRRYLNHQAVEMTQAIYRSIVEVLWSQLYTFSPFPLNSLANIKKINNAHFAVEIKFLITSKVGMLA